MAVKKVTQKEVKWIKAQKGKPGYLALRSDPSKAFSGVVIGIKGSSTFSEGGVARYVNGRNVTRMGAEGKRPVPGRKPVTRSVSTNVADRRNAGRTYMDQPYRSGKTRPIPGKSEAARRYNESQRAYPSRRVAQEQEKALDRSLLVASMLPVAGGVGRAAMGARAIAAAGRSAASGAERGIAALGMRSTSQAAKKAVSPMRGAGTTKGVSKKTGGPLKEGKPVAAGPKKPTPTQAAAARRAMSARKAAETRARNKAAAMDKKKK